MFLKLCMSMCLCLVCAIHIIHSRVLVHDILLHARVHACPILLYCGYACYCVYCVCLNVCHVLGCLHYIASLCCSHIINIRVCVVFFFFAYVLNVSFIIVWIVFIVLRF